MSHTHYDRTLAFAGLCQAVKLVQQVARRGSGDGDAITTCLNTILMTDPKDTLTVFGSEAQLTLGLETLIREVESSNVDKDITRYVVSVLAIERKLSARADSLSQLKDRIEILQHQQAHFSLDSDTMMSHLANVYVDIISPLGPRIQINGAPEQLKHNYVQDRVRALLLSAIRCAVLWRQVGGKRRQLLLSRNTLAEQAKLILANTNTLTH